MKPVVVLTLLFLSQVALAYNAENIRAFLKKNKTCAFATYRVMRGKATRESFPQRFDVTCVGDVRIGEGTISEKRGCGAFNFNVESGKRTNLTQFGPNIAEDKSCDSAGFEQVVNELLYNDNSETPGRKVLVKDFLVPFPDNNGPTDFFRFVVYSEKDSYRTLLGYPLADVNLNVVDARPKLIKADKTTSQDGKQQSNSPIGISGIKTKGRR